MSLATFSIQAYSSMKEDLAFKEGEVEKSRNTLEGLSREHQQLTLNLEKIEALEDKIKTEMTTLKVVRHTQHGHRTRRRRAVHFFFGHKFFCFFKVWKMR